MTIKRKACIAGAFEHPLRKAENRTLPQLHAEMAKGALEDAGLSKRDVDGYFCAGDSPGLGPLSMAEYLGLKPRLVNIGKHHIRAAVDEVTCNGKAKAIRRASHDGGFPLNGQ